MKNTSTTVVVAITRIFEPPTTSTVDDKKGSTFMGEDW
jgi:hypothetical protein